MSEFQIPDSNALRDIADLVDQVHRLRLTITGTPAQPGLLAQVESARPVVGQLSESLVELREQNGTSIELAKQLDSSCRDLLVAIPDRLLGALNSSTFDEKLRREVASLVSELGHETALARLKLAANDLATEAGESAEKLVANILAERGAENVVALAAQLETIEANARIQLAEMESANKIEIKRLNTQHLREIDGLQHQLGLTKSELANKTAELETQSNRLALATQAREKNLFGWVIVSVAIGVILGALLPDILKLIGN